MALTSKLSLAGQMACQADLIVRSVLQTSYEHVEAIDVDRGVYNCDCNGFVSFVMGRSAPAHYSMIPKESTQLRPRAFEYYVFFESLAPHPPDGWQRINYLQDAQRGDIIAWRFPEVLKGHDTGHVLLVAETPVLNDSGTFSVRVYDSADQAHFDDTRGTGPAESPGGVGSGVINFKVDDLGKPASFQFAPGDEFESFPIAVGRVKSFSD